MDIFRTWSCNRDGDLRRVFDYTWEQGHGFVGSPVDVGPYSSYQAAYGEIQRMNRRLTERGLIDWAAAGDVERVDDTWWIRDAHVYLIQ